METAQKVKVETVVKAPLGTVWNAWNTPDEVVRLKAGPP